MLLVDGSIIMTITTYYHPGLIFYGYLLWYDPVCAYV